VVGFGVPKNTPAAIIDTLNKGFNAALADATIKKRLAELGALAMRPTLRPNSQNSSTPTPKVGQGDQGVGIKPE